MKQIFWSASILSLLAVTIFVSARPSSAFAYEPYPRPVSSQDCEAALTLGPEAGLRVMFRDGVTDFKAAEALADKIDRLSAPEKENWLQTIGRVYRSFPKDVEGYKLNGAKIGARRALDYLLTRLENYPWYVQDDAKAGFEHFIARQNYIFGTKYNAEDIFFIARMIQAELVARNSDAIILMAGSFVNGKGDLATSDLDYSTSDRAIADMSTEWQGRLNAHLNERHLNANIHFEGYHYFLSSEPLSERINIYGGVNPMQILVKKDKIELLVLGRATGSTFRDIRAATPRYLDLHL